jgi:Flp pilus assembly protein TadD
MNTPFATILILAGALVASSPAPAQDAGSRFPGSLEPDVLEEAVAPPAPESEETRETRLDRLYARLKEAPDEKRASGIARNIQRELLNSGSPTIALLMTQAAAAVGAKDLPVALDLLDAVVRLKPGYAEGWNRRATVYFMLDDYGKSLADLERALALEPRNWEAIGGLASILSALDEKEGARVACQHALEIYPLQPRIKKACDELEDERDGEDI